MIVSEPHELKPSIPVASERYYLKTFIFNHKYADILSILRLFLLKILSFILLRSV